jgi:sulfide dehydrogenase cytochrome subunit
MRAPLLLSGIAAAAIAGLLIASPGQTDELSRGQMLSASCAGCHGTDGHSPGSIPDISGKSADFIRASLMEFKSGQRPSTVMGRQAKGYTDEEIQLIAEYFEQQR